MMSILGSVHSTFAGSLSSTFGPTGGVPTAKAVFGNGPGVAQATVESSAVMVPESMMVQAPAARAPIFSFKMPRAGSLMMTGSRSTLPVLHTSS